MKIKLRDMTEEQYVKWRTKKCIEGGHNCENCIFRKAVCYHVSGNCWIYNKNLYSSKFLNQEIDIEIEYEDGLILNAKEKEYLEAILRPFKNRVESICKYKLNGYEYANASKEYEMLSISFKPFRKRLLIYVYSGYKQNSMQFPPFKKGLMYKNMQADKHYTLEELGLFEDGE